MDGGAADGSATATGTDEPGPAQGPVTVPAGAAVTWWRSAVDGTVHFLGGSFSDLAGLSGPDDAAGWTNLVHPDDLEVVAAFDDEAAGHVAIFRIRRPDGAIRWVRSRVIEPSVRDGEQGWLGLAEDVTSEQGLVIDDRRGEDVLAEVAALLMEADVDGYDQAVDASLAAIGHLVSADRSYVFWLHDDDTKLSNSHEWCAAGVEPMIQHLQDFDAADASWFLDTVRREPGGTVISVPHMPTDAPEREVLAMQGIQTLALVPIEQQGRMAGFVGFDSVRDLREWRPAQLGVLRRFAVLVLAARHRSETLRKLVEARDVAEQANEAKTRFISRASHELRTPLNAVVGFAELLEQPATDAEREEFLGLLTGSARHLSQIVTDLLDVLRAEAHHDGPESSAELSTIVAATAELLGVTACERDVELRVDVPAEGLSVRRPDLVRQIMANLVSNSIKYNRPGGRVAVRGDRDGGQVRIVVSDTGIGIPVPLQHRLFAPFDRLGAEHGEEPGTGLGLAIVQRAVDTLDGEITIDSRPDVGTTVTVRIPVAGVG